MSIPIKKLTDDQLEKRLLDLTCQERQIVDLVLEHLKEVEERRLFAYRGYPSLFAYCTEYLKYSEGAASRRIRSMRLLKECPDVQKEISTGELSLSNVARAASFFRQEEKQQNTYSSQQKVEILRSLRGKSQREAEQTFAGLNPQAVKIQERQRPISEEFTELQLTLDKESTRQIERIRQLKPEMSLNELFQWMLSRSLKQIDPSRKPKSLPQRKLEKHEPRGQKNKATPMRKPLSRAKKYRIWQRCDGRCQFRSSHNGKICGGSAGLEIDHIQPLILGGTDELHNLRLLCREHHRLMTKESFLE